MRLRLACWFLGQNEYPEQGYLSILQGIYQELKTWFCVVKVSHSVSSDFRYSRVDSPSSINLKEVIEIGLVITTASRSIDLLQRGRRGEGNLVGANSNNGAILLMEGMDVHGPVGVEFVPFQYQGGKVGEQRSRYLSNWRCDSKGDMDEQQQSRRGRDEQW